MPEESFGRLFTEGWGCDPTWIVVCPGASQHRLMGGARFSPNGHLQRKARLLNIPESFAFSVLHNKPHSALFSQDVLQELQSGLTQIPMETLLCPGTQYT